MNDSVINAVPVETSDRLPFKCTRCSACCRHVRQSVPLECLDIFRMTKFFRERDPSIKSTDDFLARYAEPALLDECVFLYLCSKSREKMTHVFFFRKIGVRYKM